MNKSKYLITLYEILKFFKKHLYLSSFKLNFPKKTPNKFFQHLKSAKTPFLLPEKNEYAVKLYFNK
jgi:hypothetical protein